MASSFPIVPTIAPGVNGASSNSKKKADLPRLSELSPDDKPWDTHGQNSQNLMCVFSEGDDWQQRKSERMEWCGRRLTFAVSQEGRHKLKSAQFCRIRLCPRCVWRRSLAWKARWYKAWPEIQKLAPKARYFHLVLTVPNVPVTELRETILKMSKAWNRMVSRKTWPALGFVRATEVTIAEEEGYVHPHFHCLVMVSTSYFSKRYMTAEDWRAYWAKGLGVEPETLIKPYIRAVDPKGGVDAVAAAVKEVFKYAVKGIMMKPDDDGSWVPTLLEMDRQLKGTQATSLGGLIREVFRGEEEISEEEMLAHTDDPDFKAEQYWEYVWSFVDRYYHRSRVLSQEEGEAIEAKDQERADRKERARAAEEVLKPDAATKVEWDMNKVGLELLKLDATPQATKRARRRRAEKREELKREDWRLDRQGDP
ncbi:MAG TPA: protein rep [Oligoflexus sp.]|uniref:protein rep n=1 Tax=Oligoflexus sp. TaxID=1971216 RepID=UPI002D7637A9|nr:protein rep [Oligoflexus sp.]HYX39841.1 protein rep [Oligoflexus sp.]